MLDKSKSLSFIFVYYRFFPVSGCSVLYFYPDKFYYKNTKNIFCVRKIFQFSSVTQWSDMQFKSSMNTQKNHFDLKCMMIVDC